jgi:hypothetical protein
VRKSGTSWGKTAGEWATGCTSRRHVS